MAQQPIEILIRKNDGATGGASEGIEKVDKTPTTASPRKPTQEINRTAQLVLTRAISLGKEALGTVLDKHAEWSGDSIMSNKYKRALNIGSSALMIYAGGWIGAGYVAGKEILGIYSSIKDLQIERRKIEYNNARLGRVVNK